MADAGKRSTWILGISAYYHDSAACLLGEGRIVAAAQQERFTRKKHDARFPDQAVAYCLREGRVNLNDLAYVVFYDKPLLKFERILETYLTFAPRGIRSFVASMPLWLKEKLFLKDLLNRQLLELDPGIGKSDLPPLLFAEHHESHAVSAFHPSPFQRAAVLCVDGVGEWATTSAWMGEDSRITPLWELTFPHSLGLLYSAFTYFTGFKVNSGEHKVMGLAPYGRPTYVKAIYDNLIELKPDGTFRLNMDFFNYCTGLTMTNEKFGRLFDGPMRKPESRLTQREMDLARSIQEVTEEVMLRLARTLHRETQAENLCLAGGVALNCVANGRILREGAVSGIMDSAGRRRCWRGSRCRSGCLASTRCQATQGPGRRRRHGRELPGALLHERGDRAIPPKERLCVCPAQWGRVPVPGRGCPGRREGRRLVSRPHGIWAEGLGESQYHR